MIQFSKVARLGLYEPIHKALRASMADALTTVGRIDAADADGIREGLSRVRDLLGFCREHLFIENQFVHPAMNGRRPDSACATAADHVRDEEEFERLETELRMIERSAGYERENALRQLYRHLALFIASNLQHMHVEETENNLVLWGIYTDAELQDLHRTIEASIPADRKMAYLRWIVPSVPHPDRVAMLTKIKTGLPAEAFEGVLRLIRPHLSDKDWSSLVLVFRPQTVFA